jgi:hypothetical protein
MSVTQLETIEYLPFVKAYPALSKTYGEVSCIAGVRVCADETPEWVRLYPVPFRALDDAQQFGKYQPVSVRVSAHGGDRRPETRRPDRDSITIVGNPISTRNGWEARRRFVEPLMVSSMCEVLRKQRVDGTSLAVFRPKRVLDLLISPADVQEEKVRIAKAWAAQPSPRPRRGISFARSSRSLGRSDTAMSAMTTPATATRSRSWIGRSPRSIGRCAGTTTGRTASRHDGSGSCAAMTATPRSLSATCTSTCHLSSCSACGGRLHGRSR